MAGVYILIDRLRQAALPIAAIPDKGYDLVEKVRTRMQLATSPGDETLKLTGEQAAYFRRELKRLANN